MSLEGLSQNDAGFYNPWKSYLEVSTFFMAFTILHIPYNCTTKPLSTVSTISSNYRPALIEVNNNRRKLVNGEHNCPRQKAKHSRSHFTAGASRRRRLGCSQWVGRGISLQISIYHLNHISLLGHLLNRMTDSKKLSYGFIRHMAADLMHESTWICGLWRQRQYVAVKNLDTLSYMYIHTHTYIYIHIYIHKLNIDSRQIK